MSDAVNVLSKHFRHPAPTQQATEHLLADLADYWGETPADPGDVRMRTIFALLLHDLLDAIDEFGYAAVYFGVGCAAFPDAVPLDEDTPCPGPAPAP